MKKKRWNQKAKRRIVLASAVLAALLLACSVYAIVNTKRVKSIENNFTPSAVTIAVEEKLSSARGARFGNSSTTSASSIYVPTDGLTWTLDTENKTYSAYKEIRILNVNKADENNVQAYVRVCLVPRWCTQLTVENVTDGVLQEDSSRKVEVDVTNQEGYSSFGTLTDIKLENDKKELIEKMGAFIISNGMDKIHENSSDLAVSQGRFAFLLKICFPSYRDMCSMFTWLDKKPWLLPFGWALRGFRSIMYRRGNVRLHVDSFKQGDASRGRELLKFYSECGI